MNTTNAVALFNILSLAALGACADDFEASRPDAPASKRSESTGSDVDRVAADNTDRNERDRDGASVTPMDQSQSGPDIDITARIRKSILDDHSIASDAGNIKIVTSAGVVTLRGPVANSAESTSIEAKARAVVGVSRVDNQLDVLH